MVEVSLDRGALTTGIAAMAGVLHIKGVGLGGEMKNLPTQNLKC